MRIEDLLKKKVIGKMILGDLLIEKEDSKCFIYINGQRIDIEQANFSQVLNSNMGKDFSSEIMTLLDKMPAKISKQSIRLESNYDLYINNINEISKTVYGIKVGETRRNEAFNIIRKILKKEADFDKHSQYVSFDEIGLAMYFSPENDFVEEIILSSPFDGATTSGLKIGQSIEKAIELCGEPKIKSIVTAFWNNFSVVIANDMIKSIKIK